MHIYVFLIENERKNNPQSRVQGIRLENTMPHTRMHARTHKAATLAEKFKYIRKLRGHHI